MDLRYGFFTKSLHYGSNFPLILILLILFSIQVSSPPVFYRLLHSLLIFLIHAKWNMLRDLTCWFWLYRGSLPSWRTFSCVENLSWIPDSLKRELEVAHRLLCILL